jgi:tetratricopeptide (TPR) repeat protein
MPAGDAGAQESGEITVTGTRIRNPNLESAVPVTSIGGEEIRVSDRLASRAARRGDWNACTIEDPGRNLDRCRGPVATVARGARGRGTAPLAEGLSKAWTGDLDGAMAAFDRAIEAAPRSSSAWLNRGLAWRRRGDLGRALADLDQAVLYAPNDARAYYHRGLVLRQRGDLRRARADEARAVELDPRYAPLVRSR